MKATEFASTLQKDGISSEPSEDVMYLGYSLLLSLGLLVLIPHFLFKALAHGKYIGRFVSSASGRFHQPAESRSSGSTAFRLVKLRPRGRWRNGSNSSFHITRWSSRRSR